MTAAIAAFLIVWRTTQAEETMPKASKLNVVIFLLLAAAGVTAFIDPRFSGLFSALAAMLAVWPSLRSWRP